MYVRIRRWVVWWMILGIVGGATAVANIFARDLSLVAVRFLLAFGVAHWFLGGLVCYCYDGIQVVERDEEAESSLVPMTVASGLAF